jgi:hypothetical protein
MGTAEESLRRDDRDCDDLDRLQAKVGSTDDAANKARLPITAEDHFIPDCAWYV